MANVIAYNGSDKWKIKATELLNQSGSAQPQIYYDTTANWNAQTTLISSVNTMYVYTDYRVEDGQNIPNVKVGDGLAYLIDLPFLNMDVTEAERTFWNNKVTTIDTVTNETLILTRN